MDFTINGQRYKAVKLDAFAQLHVARRLAPALGKIFDALGAMNIKATQAMLQTTPVEDMSMQGVSKILTPMAEALACLPDDDVDFILGKCLSVVEIQQQGGAWAKVWVNGLAMFPLDLPVILQIAWRVLSGSIAGFTPGLLSPSSDAGQTSGATG